MTGDGSYRPVGCTKAAASSVPRCVAAITFSLNFICRCQGFVFLANRPHVSALTPQRRQQGRTNTLPVATSSGGAGSYGGDYSVGWRQRRPRQNREQQADGALRMSVRDMIGADVESGGLFDPLGEDDTLRHQHQGCRSLDLEVAWGGARGEGGEFEVTSPINCA